MRMNNGIRVKVIHGEHKGKEGILGGMFWAANVALINMFDGEEIAVKSIEITTI